MEQLSIADHPLLDLQAFVTEFPHTLGEMRSSAEMQELMSLDATAPLQSSDKVRLVIRDLLRHDGLSQPVAISRHPNT